MARYSAPAAGKMVESICSTYKDPWIIDTGATNQMVVDLKAAIKTSIFNTDFPKRLHFPNGDTSLFTHVRSSNMFGFDIYTNVFNFLYRNTPGFEL